jgi:hypothetical protein
MTFLYPEPCVVPESSRMIYSWCMLLPLPCTQLTSDHTLIAVCLEGLASVHATHLCVRIQLKGHAVRRMRCQQHRSSSAIAVSFPAAAAAAAAAVPLPHAARKKPRARRGCVRCKRVPCCLAALGGDVSNSLQPLS